ncbi:hypothetical protein [Cloacibacillus sp.]
MNREKRRAGMIVVGLAVVIFGGFVYYSNTNMRASADAHRIAADMSNLRAAVFAYYSETGSWPRAVAEVQNNESSHVGIDTEGLSVVNDDGALFVKYDGAETALIPERGSRVAAELAALRSEDRLYAEPTKNPAAAPDYAGGTSVYMLIKTKDYNPNSQF